MSNSDDHVDSDARHCVRRESSPGISRRRLFTSVAAFALGSSGATTRTVAGSPETVDDRTGISDDAGRLKEEVWVETTVDSDDSGTNDRIYLQVTRPESTANGAQVPVIAAATPYNAEQTHSDTTPEMMFDRSVELSAGGEKASDDETAGRGRVDSAAGGTRGDGSRTGTDGRAPHGSVGRGRHSPDQFSHRRLERRYVPDGYAFAHVSSLGTHESTGCYTAAGPKTAEALKAVVDWFNGRATAYDAKRGGTPIEADWTNGKTGMIGTSANGELANAVATTGVDGLEAIVPNAANNGQYSLFRSNGTPISVTPNLSGKIVDLSSWVEASNQKRSDCDHVAERVAELQDHETGDYNDFWHEREFLPQAESVEAAVLLSGAVNDPIVKPNNVADWYEMLERADVPVRLWLHKGGHRPPESPQWNDLVDRWWEYWLKDVDNGVMDEDPVSVVHHGESARSGTLQAYPTWPVPDAKPTTVRFGPST
jgi:X-Pro dipeptidyl-peptidase